MILRGQVRRSAVMLTTLGIVTGFSPKPTAAQAIIGAAAAAYGVERFGDFLSKATSDVEQLRIRAMQDGNLALEQRIEQIQLALQNIAQVLSADVDRKIATLSTDARTYVDRVVLALQTTNESIYDATSRLELSANLAIADICAGLPLICQSKYSISSIRNIVVVPSTGGNHRLFVGGTAFTSDGVAVTAFLDGTQLPPSGIQETEERAIYEISLPGTLITPDDRQLKRPKFRLVATGIVDNSDRAFWHFWKPKQIRDTVADIAIPLYVLPAKPLRVRLTELVQYDDYDTCQGCREPYSGYTTADRISRVTEHVIRIGKDYTLDSVLSRQPSLREVVGNDTYILYCTKPTMRETATGEHQIVSRCLDAAINRSCAKLANRFYDNPNEAVRDSIVDYPYPCFALAVTRRAVRYEVTLKRKRIAVRSKELALQRASADPDSTYSIGFGDHLSVPLASEQSGVSALLSVDLGVATAPRVINLGIPLTDVPTIGRAEIKIIRNGPSWMAQLSLVPASLRDLQNAPSFR